jgi:hypothetical protein
MYVGPFSEILAKAELVQTKSTEQLCNSLDAEGCNLGKQFPARRAGQIGTPMTCNYFYGNYGSLLTDTS